MKYIFSVFVFLFSAIFLRAQCSCVSTCSGSNTQLSKVAAQQIINSNWKVQDKTYETIGDMLIQKPNVFQIVSSNSQDSPIEFYGYELDANGKGIYVPLPNLNFTWRTWENSRVPYTIAIGTEHYKQQIETAVKVLNARTNICLTPKTRSDNDYIEFVASNAIDGSGGHSSIGRVGGGGQEVVFQGRNDNVIYYILWHEIFHALGLFHTQQFPNRDNYIHINWPNLCPDHIGNFHMVKKLPSNYSELYDGNSIMQYKQCSFAKGSDYVFSCEKGGHFSCANCPKGMSAGVYIYGFSNNDIKLINQLYPNKNNCEKQTSLLLIDVSGSMNENNKIYQARQAAVNKIQQLDQEAQKMGKTPEIEIMVFSGDCVTDPTHIIQPFTTDLKLAEASVLNIPYPNGGTPLVQAIQQAENSLNIQLKQNDQDCGTLIVLSDGQSSCGPIRPPADYVGQYIKKKPCSTSRNVSANSNITYYTVGFGIEAGSVAERDLQYLAFNSGGKYFNAQDLYQLSRSFQKINRTYLPITDPQTGFIDSVFANVFFLGTLYASIEQYDTALVFYKKFITAYPNDSSGQYNYALMCEANERYKTAVKYYELYLQHAPKDPNRQYLLDRIATLRKDYEIFLAYNKQIIQSDLAYLSQHFEQLRTTPDAVPLAGEFTGFIQEKQSFYKLLPDILEMDDPWLKRYAKEISQALKEANYFLSKNPKQWDLDGISMIGNVYEPLDRLTKNLGK